MANAYKVAIEVESLIRYNACTKYYTCETGWLCSSIKSTTSNLSPDAAIRTDMNIGQPCLKVLHKLHDTIVAITVTYDEVLCPLLLGLNS